MLYGNEPEEMYDSFVIKRRRWGWGCEGSRLFSEGTLRFSSAVIVYDPLHFMETSLLDLRFDANWRMRSSGLEAYDRKPRS